MEECISGHCYTVYIKMSKCSVLPVGSAEGKEKMGETAAWGKKWGREGRGSRSRYTVQHYNI